MGMTFNDRDKFGPNGLLHSRHLLDTPHFPFVVSFELDIWSPELGTWLLSIGKNHIQWEWWWQNGIYNFEFKEEEDKVKFILRWL